MCFMHEEDELISCLAQTFNSRRPNGSGDTRRAEVVRLLFILIISQNDSTENASLESVLLAAAVCFIES